MKKKNKIVKFGLLKSIIITLVFALLLYYWVHPAIDLHNIVFYLFLTPILALFFFSNLMFQSKLVFTNLENGHVDVQSGKISKLWLIVPLYVCILLVYAFFNTPLLQASSYYNRIKIDTSSSFDEDIEEVDFNKLPLLDKDSSSKLGDRVMGGMSDLVSQYDVSDEYTQINYNDEIIRVTPLEYHGVVKWFTNRGKGITGYITVNSTNGKAKLVKLENGMKYAPSALFNENLYRQLQFQYPFYNFDSINFEIDNEGNPYWVASVIKYHGLNQRREVTGVVIFDPITAKSNYYKVEDVPTWVDHVYEADLILEQVNDWGAYKNGFWNSVVTEKEVVATTTGYNYLAFNDDVYLYTGITSVLTDESNIGFILTNMRTKETKFYSVPGAEEYSAMDSAKGQVQQMRYSSTFPLLINLGGRPTYLISLKDNAGLVKMYAFVDVVDYQRVVVTDSSKGIQTAADAYLSEMNDVSTNTGKLEKDINITSLKETIIDGNTYYYFKDYDGQKYKVSINTNRDILPFLNNGDYVHIIYNKESDVITISKITLN